jgi:hypothetical protein
MGSRFLPLMGGRRRAPLSDQQVSRVIETFTGLDAEVRTVRYDPDSSTVFRIVNVDESDTGEEYGEIVFGPDIFPGTDVATANSLLSYRAAAAHELTHYHRWLNATHLNGTEFIDLDEALTSLEAVRRYGHKLDPVEIEQLIGDALQRLARVTVSGVPPHPTDV